MSAVQPVCLAVALSLVLSGVILCGTPCGLDCWSVKVYLPSGLFVVISICGYLSIFASVCGSVCKSVCGLDVALSVIYPWGQLEEQRLAENVRWISSWYYRPDTVACGRTGAS